MSSVDKIICSSQLPLESQSGFTTSSLKLLLRRVPLIKQSWNPGLEEVETQGGNGRKWESERERVLKSFAFVCKMI